MYPPTVMISDIHIVMPILLMQVEPGLGMIPKNWKIFQINDIMPPHTMFPKLEPGLARILKNWNIFDIMLPHIMFLKKA